MNTLIARLRVHRSNIDRYENMLKTVLTDHERQFVEKRLSEERIALSVLEFMGPAPGDATDKSLQQRPE